MRSGSDRPVRGRVGDKRSWAEVRRTVSRQPDFAQNLVLMFPEPRRPAVQGERVRAHHEGCADAGNALRIDSHAACGELRIGKKVGHRVDRPGRDDSGFKRREQVVALPEPCLCDQRFLQNLAVCDAGRVADKARVAASASSPSAPQSRPNCPSLPTAMISQPSATGSV